MLTNLKTGKHILVESKLLFTLIETCAKGYGKKLYTKLLDILKQQGIKTACACVTEINENSLIFHKNLGFKEVGRFHNAGYKLEKWYDIIWLEKPLNNYDSVPSEILKITDIKNLNFEEF